ncbi:MAG: DUF896 domain-containing protein [Clostridia bacterium]|nr:DUF896 domain-containing protein [Clostridia bacterium]MBO5206276.1 DUF896 domain-containing protein [Clostridia bacterium]MBP3583837.1 DUF896 domain-containing protein [Clostridia bacterium]
MDKNKVDRINELGRISKTRPLTEEELAEQKALREEYLAYVRATLRGGAKNGK